jgi:hypothetical protein
MARRKLRTAQGVNRTDKPRLAAGLCPNTRKTPRICDETAQSQGFPSA